MTRVRVWNLARWNERQIETWLRWSRRTGAPCTPERVAEFGRRYAERHQWERLKIAA